MINLKTIFSQFLGILVFERQEVLPQFYRRREEFSGIEFELPLPLPETPSENQEELPKNNINNKHLGASHSKSSEYPFTLLG